MADLSNILVENLDNPKSNSIQIIKDSLQSSNVFENKCKMREFLWTLSHISRNHCHTSHFLENVEQLLIVIKNEIKILCLEQDLINIGKTNKMFLLFFLKHNLISVDFLMKQKLFMTDSFLHYFYYELDPNSTSALSNTVCVDPKLIFFQKRQIGENDTEICEFIRDDSIDSFIQSYNQFNYNICTIIPKSIYETNEELDNSTGNGLTLIEYAAFFGSAKIFKFLYLQKQSLPDNLWKYAIHGRNYEIIHILDEIKHPPPSNSYKILLFEAIRCHNNEIVSYIIEHYLQTEIESIQLKYEIMEAIIQSYNYPLMKHHLEDNFTFTNTLFVDLCKFDYYHIVEILLKSQDINVNYQSISFGIFYSISNSSF